MRGILIISLALIALASAKSVLPEQEDKDVKLGYHEAVGIPEAARLKAEEETIFADGLDSEIAADETSDNRIVGGVIAPSSAHPHLGGLVISLVGVAGNSVCGSSLVTSNRLVTAAHCWFDGNRQAWQFVVVLGSQFLFSGGTRIATTNVITHPQWTPSTLANDVAVIFLPTNVLFSHSIQPVALPSGTQLNSDFAGMWGTAAGYGKTNDQQVGVTTATQISHVNLQVITFAACRAVFGNFIIDSTICTNGAGGVGICGGDSGGPLVVNQNGQNVLVGISSFVAANGCQLGFPSAFARVTSFYSFIFQNL